MNVIVKAVAGSHLFGLNTPTSDLDYKGIYMPSPEDIVLGRIKTSVKDSTNNTSEKNNPGDIDCEFYSFDKFMRMLQEGQTVALEMLFTPDEFILEKSPLWDEIVARREEFLHKKVTAFIGYAKTQADKYGIKGSRMGTMKNAVTMLSDWKKENPEIEKLHEIWEFIVNFTNNHEHSSIMNLAANKNMQNRLVPHWEVCGRKFDSSIRIDYCLNILQKIYDGYGERAKQAEKNNGVDWKAVSHALRVCHQGSELLRTGKITLPIHESMGEFILKVKKGEMDFTTEVQPMVEAALVSLEYEKEESKLPEKLDPKFVDDFIMKVYSKYLLDEL